MNSPAKVFYNVFFLVLSLTLLKSLSASAQLSFIKTYNLTTSSTPISKLDEAGGIVTAGTYMHDQTKVEFNVSLTRYDKTGKVIWSKYYQWPGGNLSLISFVLADNGEYMLAGYAQPKNDQSRYEIFLFRVNKNGEVVWSRNYNKEYSSIFYSLDRAGDHGFFLHANHNDAPAGLSNNIVIKVDKNGHLEWTRRYFDTYKWGTATATRDGGLVISNIGTIYKINAEGKIVWAKEYDEIFRHDIRTISELSDGGILLIAPQANDKEGFLLKLDKNGNLVWIKGGWIFYSYNYVPLANPAGSFILASTYYRSILKYNSCIFHIDANGEIIQTIYSKNDINIHSVIPSGNAFFISGTQYNEELRKYYQVVGKINSLEPGACMDTISLVTSTPPKISYSNVNVLSQNEISFQEKDLPLEINNLELQEDTLCFDCKEPEINLGSDTTLCAGEILTLNAGIQDVTYEWSTGEKTTSINVDKAGIYWLKITNECGSVTDTIKVNYNKEPEFRVKVSPLLAKPWEQLYFSDSTSGIKNRYWDFGDGSFSNSAKAEHIYGKNGDFTVKLQLEDSFGCKYTFEENIKVKFESLYLPNAFSPDGNGLNDSFGFVGYGIDFYKLKIYNRWGELIFDLENQGWDGKYNGAYCPAGLYLYMLEAKFENKTVNRYGYVYLEK